MRRRRCECGTLRVPGSVACARCGWVDGIWGCRGSEITYSSMLVETLQVLGGSARWSAIFEDWGVKDLKGKVANALYQAAVRLEERGRIVRRYDNFMFDGDPSCGGRYEPILVLR